MPIFEFVCTECGNSFEELVRSASAVGEVVCPACQSQKIEKKISMFASRVSGGVGSSSFSLSSGAGCSTASTGGT